MISSIFNKHYYRYLVEGTSIEIIWTCIPALILLSISFPSLQLLYSMDEIVDPSLTIKAIGHQ
jgi:cytochrome c oxidase subunit 2